MDAGRRRDSDGRKLVKVALTSLSAMAAETATFPIDTTKTRLQLLRSSSSHPPAGAVKVAADIVRSHGITGLYRGLPPGILRHLFYTPIRILTYEQLRFVVPGDSLAGRAVAGGFSGVIAQIVASPADLVKVRMQADSRMANLGQEPRYSGTFDAVSKIIRSEGFMGLWKGVFPNVQRAFLVNMGELACYDQAKRLVISNRICDDNIYAHTMASVMSGLCATTLSCPADVVKTRMMNQSLDQGSRILYRTSYDCLVKTVKHEGLPALWKGFFPTWARLGPWQFVFWVSYEKLRKLAGISSF